MTNATMPGNQDLNAPPDEHVRSFYPSIMETIPASHPDLRREFGKLEDQMMRQQIGKTQLTHVLGGLNDR